ncbi:MAG: desulfoferrodoxin [Deltaproteobacteria bacterium]|nr:desulfoferrodoxin [Deltaproteobacteria bacterium]
MAKLNEVYKCLKCGNILATLHEGTCVPDCCGEAMRLLKEGSTDGAKEKHVPVIEKTAAGYKVKVGSVSHPMEDKHWIEWIELIADGKSYRQFLKPGQIPEADFPLKADKVTAREYCNLHGHWKAEA